MFNLDQIYREHSSAVIAFLRRIGFSAADSEDLCQETFIKVSEKIDEFEGKSSIRTWICAIARNMGNNHRRMSDRRGHYTAQVVDFLENHSPPDSGLIDSLRARLNPRFHPVLDALTQGMTGGDAEKQGIVDSRATFMRHKNHIAAIACEITHG